MLDLAARHAPRRWHAHSKGKSVIAIDSDPGLVQAGRPVTVITVVNDNMPFLFDSIMGEITGTGRRTHAGHCIR